MLSNKRFRKVSRLQVGAVLAVAVLGVSSLAVPTYADTAINGSSSNLSLPGSFTPTGLPQPSDTVTIDGALGGVFNYTLNGSQLWNGINFINPTSSVSIGGATDQLAFNGAGITMSGSNSSGLTLDSQLFLFNSQSWITNATQGITFSNTFDLQSSVLTVGGTGTVTETSTANITDGDLRISGGTLVMNTTTNSYGNTILGGGRIVLVDNSGASHVNSALGTGTITVLANTRTIIDTTANGLRVSNNFVLQGGTLTYRAAPNTGNLTANSFGGTFSGNGVIEWAIADNSGARAHELGGVGVDPSVGPFANFSGTLAITNHQSNWVNFVDPRLDNTYVILEGAGQQGLIQGETATNGSERVSMSGAARSITFGALQATDGGMQFSGSNNNASTYIIGNLGINTTFAGAFLNSGSGPLGITKQGTGTLTLTNNSGTANFTGVITVQDGVLEMAKLNGTNAMVLGNETASGAATFRVIGSNSITTSGAVTVNGTGTFDAAGGTLAFTSTAAVTQTASTANAYGGLTTVRTVNLTGSNAGVTNQFAAALSDFGTVNAFNGVGTITTAIVKSGATTWSITSSGNNYSGGTTVQAGTLLINSATGSVLGTGPVAVNGGKLMGIGNIAGSISVAAAGTLSPGIDGVLASLGTLTLTGNAGLTLATGSTLKLDIAAVPLGADLIKLTSGNLNLSGTAGSVNVTLLNGPSQTAFGYNGTYTLFNFAGTANFFDGGAHLAAGTTLTDFNVTNGFVNGTFGAATYTFAVNAAGNGITVSVANGLAVSNWTGAVSGNWDTTTTGNWAGAIPGGTTGDVALFGTASTTTGAVAVNVVSGRSLGALGFDNSVATSNSVSYTLSGAKLTFSNTGSDAQIALSNVKQSQTILNPLEIDSNTTITLANGQSTLTLGGVLSQSTFGNPPATGITVSGSGRLLLTNTTINGWGGTLTILSGATVQLGNNNASGLLKNGTTIVNSGTLISNRSDAIALNYNVSGSGLYSINSGTIGLNGSGSIAANTIVNTAAGAALDLAGVSTTIAGISGNGTVNNSVAASTLTLNPAAGQSTTFSGVIRNNTGTALTLVMGGTAGSGSVAPGTLVLSGANTYTGGTVLNLNNTALNSTTPVGTSGAIVVANNSALGTGTIIVKGLGAISPGNGAHDLILANGVNLANAIQFQITTQTGGLSSLTQVLPGGSATLSGGITNNDGRSFGGDVALNALVRLGSGSSGSTLTLTGLINSIDPDGANGTGIAITDGNVVIGTATGPSGTLTAFSNALNSRFYLGSTFGSPASATANITLNGNSVVTSQFDPVDLAAGVIGGNSLTLTTVTMNNNSVINVGANLLDWNGTNSGGGGQTTINMNGNSKIVAGGFTKTNDTGNTLLNSNGGTIQVGVTKASYMPGSNFTKIILGPGGLKLDLNNNYAGWLQGISGNLVNVVNASFENNLTNGTNNVTPTNYTVTNRLQTGTAATFSTQAYIPSGVNRNDIGDGKQGVLITGVGSDLYQSVGSLASGTTYTLTVSMASRGANNAYGAATGFMSVVDGGSDLGNILGQSGAIALNANSLTDYSITFTTGTASIANATVVLSQLTPNDANRVQLIADNVRLANTSTVDGGLKLLGTGTLSLQSASLDPNGATFGTSGPSTYSGVTDLGVSTIMLDGNDATSANSVFRVGAGASLIVNFGSNGDPGNVIGGLDGNGATTGLVRGNESNSSILGLNVASGTALNYGGTLGMGDPLNLIKSGGGTQTLSGVINYGGRTTLKGGVLEFASTSAVAQAGEVVIGTADSVVRSTFTGTSNTVNFTSFNANRGAGGTVVFETVGGVSGTTNKIVFAGASQGALGAGAFFRADGGAADFAYVNSNASQFLRAPNWGVDAGFVSPGTTLSNNNYNRITGAITTTGTSNPGMNFSGGTLTITSGIVTSTSGVILKSSGNSGAIAGPGILTLGNGLSEWVIRTDAATDVLDIGASLTGSGPTTALTKSGLGVLRLSASNTINGVTSILAGGIDVNNANALANSTVNYLSTGGTLGFSALVVNIGALTGDQTLNINSGTSVRVGGNNAMTIFNGGLSGGGEFHKTGSSFAQLASLAATSTFTGGVFLDSGTLSLVNGSALGTAASSLVLNGGALLYGAANLPFNTAANVVVNASNMTMTRLTGGTTDSMSGNWTSPTRQTMTMALPTGEVMLFNGTGGQFSGYSGTLSMGSSLGSLRVGGLNGTTAVDVAMGNTYVDMGSITLASTSGGTQTFGALSGASASTLTGLTGTATASTSTPATVYAIGGLNVNTTFNGNITNGTGTGATTGLIKNGSGSTLTLATTSRSYTGGTTINTGRIVALGSGTNNLTLLGTGPVTMGGAAATLQFSGANSVQTVGNIGGAGGTTNNATLGAVLVDTSVKLTTGSIRAGSLTIGGSLTLANGSPVSKVQILSIAHTGTPGTASSYTGMLQLGNNRLVLQTADSTSKAAAITALNEALFFGKGTGSSWTGTKGITSSAAAANTAQLTVGVFDNAALNRTNFAGGIGNVDPNSLIVSTALQGDANLDGIVNFNDMLAVTSNWNKQALANGISGIDMAHGDLNSDGIVNFNDMLVVTSHWNNSSSVFNLVSAINDGSLVAELDAGQGFSLSPAQVPEPASVALLAMGSAALLMRRRNKK